MDPGWCECMVQLVDKALCRMGGEWWGVGCKGWAQWGNIIIPIDVLVLALILRWLEVWTILREMKQQ